MPSPPKIVRSDTEWRTLLTDEQFRILRQKGTERPYTGVLLENNQPGSYYCAGCGELLFTNDSKFNAHCGWPTFSAAADPAAIEVRQDASHGMKRTEVCCTRCGGHLGHVFTDATRPSGQRFCINSAALQFERKK